MKKNINWHTQAKPFFMITINLCVFIAGAYSTSLLMDKPPTSFLACIERSQVLSECREILPPHSHPIKSTR